MALSARGARVFPLFAAFLGASALAAGAAARSPFQPGPPFTAPREQVLFGHVASLAPAAAGGRFTLRFDPALLLTGATASALALALTGSAEVPNDNLVFDPEHRLLTFTVAAGARATIVVNPGGRGIAARRVTIAQLARIVAGRAVPGVAPFEPRNPFWLVVAGGAALELDQQYSP